MTSRAPELLDAVVRGPRPAGSRAEADARAVCAAHLRALGFAVTEPAFEYSAVPGRYAMPMIGWVLLATALWLFWHATRPDWRGALAAALAVAAGTAVFAWWIGRYGTRRIPLVRCVSTNLEAVRGVPRVWLVAHLDSKSQPIPLLVRAAGVVTSLAAWGTLLALWIATERGGGPGTVLPLAAAVAAIGAVPLVLATISARSPGALDNGSGVAAVLRAVELAPPTWSLGVLLTSAEELGLAGARAWVAGRSPAIALNCDGVDDEGRVSVTVARDPGGTIRRALSIVLERVHGIGPVAVRRAAPGVLLDAIAFADAGWHAATVSRGGLRSLARVHGPGDTRARLRGDGIEAVARLLCGVAGAMITSAECAGSPRARESRTWSSD